MASVQLKDPGHPGTMVYHFTRPDPQNKPTELEFTEIYFDDKVFWDHLDKDQTYVEHDLIWINGYNY